MSKIEKVTKSSTMKSASIMREQMPRLREVKCVAILKHRDGRVEIREL
jgi:hypothetical protein